MSLQRHRSRDRVRWGRFGGGRGGRAVLGVAEAVEALTGLIENGSVTPVIDRGYPFAEIPAAVRYQMAGHAPGKVAVTIPG